jgi:hypothetical protein
MISRCNELVFWRFGESDSLWLNYVHVGVNSPYNLRFKTEPTWFAETTANQPTTKRYNEMKDDQLQADVEIWNF